MNMKRIAIFFAVALVASPALAQLVNQDLQVQRNNFMAAFAQCDTSMIALRQQIAMQSERIKVLEDKYEPKPAAASAVPEAPKKP
jgi:hypothetical protein